MFKLKYFVVIFVSSPLYLVNTQVVNLALKKNTKSTVFGINQPTYAVDGILSQEYHSCAHTQIIPRQSVAWWQVDLAHIAEIINITIYYRENTAVRRLNGFQISIGLYTEWQNETSCYSDNDPDYPPNITTIDECTGPGRYVTIFNYNFDALDKDYGPILELCEVQVFGCTPNKYGTECELNCHCKQKGCYQKDGVCFEPGCEAGWQGTSCNETCKTDNFGQDCNMTCHCLTESCPPDTGMCYSGCQPGWQNEACSQPCENNTFGVNCTSICHCMQGTCKTTDGECFTQGCKPGWEGKSCSTPCKLDNFGQDCNLTCHCLTGPCPPDTGICNGVCQPGWLTETCSQPCLNSTFGEGCNTTCHCNQGACDHTNGDCFIKGCKSGWEGNNCSKKCTGNTFGPDCKNTCHCSNGACDRKHGTCTIPGCKPGYQSKTCSEQCTENTFGPDCKDTCHCLAGTCDRIHGTCTIPGCKPGYQSKTCSEQCENGTFGSGCASKCHCLVGICNNENGQCNTSDCKDGWKGSTCSEKIQQDLGNSSIPKIVGALVGGLSFILVTVLITTFIFRRRRSAKGKDDAIMSQSKPDVAHDHVYDELGLPENTGAEYIDIQTNNFQETSFGNGATNTTILMIENIEDEVCEMIKNGTLQKQHKKIPCGPLYPQTAGNLTKNKKKNQNQNVLPYDHSRVILKTIDQDQEADYINASYINGLNQDSKYIATQGPMKNTVEDLWRMVWQTKSSIVVMLTNIIEDKEVTCFEYWPVSSNVLAGLEYEIILLKEQTRSEFITRELKVKNTKTGEVRKIWHLQFTSWPKQGVPVPFQLLLLHRQYTEIISAKNSGPPIIHCNDGTDRTGVFIAFDAISQCCYKNEAIDICMLVTEMRKNRINMVAKEESYVLLHKLLIEDLHFERTHLTTNDFLTAFKEWCNKKDREYEMLLNNLPEYDDTFYKEAMLKKNRGKHRNQSILPVETYRVILNTAGASHYINAVAIPSCRIPKQFFVTQIPLDNTIVDLWRMVFECNSCTIVNLEDEPSFEKNLMWHPTDENKLDLDNFMLTKTSESMTSQGIREIGIKIFDKDTNNEKFVKLFRYSNWKPVSAIPSPQTSFLDLVHVVLTWNKSNNNAPITVICADGAKCCGVFCLVYSIIENLSYSDDIDIYQMARLQQIRRPQFFSAFQEQYQFCYNIVKEYLEKVQLYNDIE